MKKYELYDLKEDISESYDLSSVHAEKAEELLNKLFLWVKNADAPIPQIETR